MAGFNKSYRNTALRVGVIIKRYDVDDPENSSQLTVEYDVVATETEAGSGMTTTLYRHCLSMDGLGSIADFFERTFRPQKTKTSKDQTQTFNDQDGAIVFLLCIDGTSDRAVIIGGLNHPDRKTTLTGDQMHLEGEFNGVNIKVNDDGSTSLTFMGTTDSQGKPTDSSQGTTQFSIEKDGSFQFMHDAITARYDRKGQMTLTAKDDITENTQTNYVVKTGKDVNVTAQGDANISVTKLVAQCSGDASLASQNCDIAAQSALTIEGSTIKLTAQSMATIKASNIVLDGQVALGGQGGQPLLLLSAMILGVGNLGAPVISQAISGFTTKVVAT
jgi:hypothetical protein